MDKILAGLSEAQGVNDVLAQLFAHEIDINNKRQEWYAEGEQQVYDLINEIIRYENCVYSLSMLFDKLSTLLSDAIKQLTPPIQIIHW